MLKSAEQSNAEAKLKDVLNGLLNITPETLTQTERLGKEYSFEKGLNTFVKIHSLFSQLMNISFENFPVSKINEVTAQVNDCKKFFDSIINFDATQITQRENILNSIEPKYLQYFNNITPILSFSLVHDDETNDYKRKLEEHFKSMAGLYIEMHQSRNKMKNEAEEMAQEIEQIKDDMQKRVDEVIASIESAAAETGVAKHESIFGTEANTYRLQSIGWLFATVAIGMGTIAWGIWGYLVLPVPEVETTFTLIKSFSTKIVVLSILTFILVWSAKNYGSTRHNFIVNKHRQNALNTFKTFVDAAGTDADIKNAILLQATTSIFSAQNTGYMGKDDGGNNTSSQVVEVIRSAGNTASAVSKMQ